MCGINAVINGSLEQLTNMTRATRRRGVKTEINTIRNAHIGFAYLPITDEQRSSAHFRYDNVCVFLNGYISNYFELATKYQIPVHTTSDTEVLAKFLDKFEGQRLNELNGFFSVLYYDNRKACWIAFTDRYGIKQLYSYKDANGTEFISSEVKGILAANPQIELDPFGIDDWKTTLGVMNSETIYKDIRRVDKIHFNTNVPKIEISYDEAMFKLNDLWMKAVKRNRYNGPTGVYLSGGIDSGMISKSFQPDYCFSMDYMEERYSEIDLIKKNSVGMHHVLIDNPQFAQMYANKTMDALDDLKAGSCYTNFALAELASKYVKVVYSGAGGDEFFGGYPHRINRPIQNVVARTDYAVVNYTDEQLKLWTSLNHFEYDLKFLQAVLIVEDRMSGWHTMETRYPLLDNDLVDFALSLPDEYKENKRILKDISGLHPDVIAGKKRGFSNPYFTNDEWVDFTLKNLKR